MYLNDSMMDLCSVREREPEKVSKSNLKEHDRYLGHWDFVRSFMSACNSLYDVPQPHNS